MSLPNVGNYDPKRINGTLSGPHSEAGRLLARKMGLTTASSDGVWSLMKIAFRRYLNQYGGFSSKALDGVVELPSEYGDDAVKSLDCGRPQGGQDDK